MKLAADAHLKVIISIVTGLSILLLYAVATPASADNSHEWRFNAHSRSIDIDICIRCTGPPGPQGPQGETGPQGPQGEQGEGVEFGQLVVTTHTIGGGPLQTSDFTIHIDGNHQFPDTCT